MNQSTFLIVLLAMNAVFLVALLFLSIGKRAKPFVRETYVDTPGANSVSQSTPESSCDPTFKKGALPLVPLSCIQTKLHGMYQPGAAPRR